MLARATRWVRRRPDTATGAKVLNRVQQVRMQSNAAQLRRGWSRIQPGIGKSGDDPGSVTIEQRVSAVIVQATFPAASGVGRTKLGDLLSTRPTWSRRPESRWQAAGITFTDGTAFKSFEQRPHGIG